MLFRSPRRKRLPSSKREELYDREQLKAVTAGLGEFPICNLCRLPVMKFQRWNESHNPRLPHAIGGEVDGIAHETCNFDHNHKHDTPLVAKIKRIRRKDIGAHRSRTQIAGGRHDRIKKKMDGTVVLRATGERA